MSLKMNIELMRNGSLRWPGHFGWISQAWLALALNDRRTNCRRLLYTKNVWIDVHDLC